MGQQITHIPAMRNTPRAEIKSKYLVRIELQIYPLIDIFVFTYARIFFS